MGKRSTNGYIFIHRKIADWYGSNSPHRLALWVHLLCKATHKPLRKLFNGKPITIKEGEMISGRKELASITGISESYVEKILTEFEKEKQIKQVKDSKGRLISILNWDSHQGVRTAVRTTVRTTERQQKDTNNTHNTHNKYIYSRVVTRLNNKTDSSYKPDTPKTQRLIQARLNEGATEQDFYTVIDKKTKQWLGDPQMNKYLRPETLFGTKFESYLNEKDEIKQRRKKL